MTEAASASTAEVKVTGTTATNDSGSTTTILTSEPKLWAGKYRTVEQLEEGYKDATKRFNVYEEKSKNLELLTKVPEKYEVPQGTGMRQTDISELEAIARGAGLSQDHFTKLVTETETRLKNNAVAFDEARKAIGDERMAVISDYVKKHYPGKLQDTVLNTIIKDKDAMNDALKHRDALLNSQAPGMSQGTTKDHQRYDGDKHLQEKAMEYKRNPNQKTRDAYVNAASEVAEARKLGQDR